MQIPLGHKLKILKKIKELKPPEKSHAQLAPLSNNQKTLIEPIIEEGKIKKPGSSSTGIEEKSLIIEENQYIEIPAPPVVKEIPVNIIIQKEVIKLKEETKECCWNCFKLFTKGSGFSDQVSKKVYKIIIKEN